MSTRQRPSVDGDREDEPRERLRPFGGYLCPGLYFSSGYALWLFEFTETPLDVGPYREVWLVTPTGRRYLWVDDPTARPVATRFHEFDVVNHAEVQWTWTEETLRVVVDAADLSTLEVDLEFETTVGVHLVNLLLALTPNWFRRTRPGMAAADLHLKLLGLGGLESAGRTETGTRYCGVVDRVAVVTGGSACLNEVDLGTVTAPSAPVPFGDVTVPQRPVVALGRIWRDLPGGGWG